MHFDCAGSRKVVDSVSRGSCSGRPRAGNRSGHVLASGFCCKVSRKSSVVRAPEFCLFRKSRCSSAVLVVCAVSIYCGRPGTSGTFYGLKRRFAGQVQDMGHFGIRVGGVALSRVDETLAGQNKRCMVLEVIFCGRHSFFNVHFSWPTQYFVIELCSRNYLGTLCVSDRSRCCGAVQV